MVLNVGAAHAGEFGSQEATAQAKSELVAALPAAADGGVAVLNADDPLVAAMAGVTPRAGGDVRARAGRRGAGRATCGWTRSGGRRSCCGPRDLEPVEVALPLHGAHHVGNALAAAAVALELGRRRSRVAAALATATPRSRWRMEVVERADGVTVVNDAYNANPDSVRAALAALAAMANGRRTWAVLGEMRELGAASAAEHEQVGRLAVGRASRACWSWVQGPDGCTAARSPRAPSTERGASSWPTCPPLSTLLPAELRPGDLVLVKASRSSGLERLADGGGVPA